MGTPCGGVGGVSGVISWWGRWGHLVGGVGGVSGVISWGIGGDASWWGIDKGLLMSFTLYTCLLIVCLFV